MFADANVYSVDCGAELKKSCGYAGITSEEGLVVEHSVSTNVKRTMQLTS